MHLPRTLGLSSAALRRVPLIKDSTAERRRSSKAACAVSQAVLDCPGRGFSGGNLAHHCCRRCVAAASAWWRPAALAFAILPALALALALLDVDAAAVARSRGLRDRAPVPAFAASMLRRRDPARRPPEPQVRSSRDCATATGPVELIANARRARKGATPGPSGCTSEHLRVLLDDEECTQLLAAAASKLARAEVPEAVVPAVRFGHMAALTKASSGVRALVMADAFRRLLQRRRAQVFVVVSSPPFSMPPHGTLADRRMEPAQLGRAGSSPGSADPVSTAPHLQGDVGPRGPDLRRRRANLLPCRLGSQVLIVGVVWAHEPSRGPLPHACF